MTRVVEKRETNEGRHLMEILAALFLAVCILYPWTVGLLTLAERWLKGRWPK